MVVVWSRAEADELRRMAQQDAKDYEDAMQKKPRRGGNRSGTQKSTTKE